jgi:hypothetical protein
LRMPMGSMLNAEAAPAAWAAESRKSRRLFVVIYQFRLSRMNDGDLSRCAAGPGTKRISVLYE